MKNAKKKRLFGLFGVVLIAAIVCGFAALSLGSCSTDADDDEILSRVSIGAGSIAFILSPYDNAKAAYSAQKGDDVELKFIVPEQDGKNIAKIAKGVIIDIYPNPKGASTIMVLNVPRESNQDNKVTVTVNESGDIIQIEGIVSLPDEKEKTEEWDFNGENSALLPVGDNESSLDGAWLSWSNPTHDPGKPWDDPVPQTIIINGNTWSGSSREMMGDTEDNLIEIDKFERYTLTYNNVNEKLVAFVSNHWIWAYDGKSKEWKWQADDHGEDFYFTYELVGNKSIMTKTDKNGKPELEGGKPMTQELGSRYVIEL